MNKERLFIITKEIDGYMVVLGYVKSRYFPSTIQNDQEKAREMFGYTHVTINEITESCDVRLCKVEQNLIIRSKQNE